MAAGTASRFAPLSYERPKGLLEVKGEVLIERQIRQLKEAGVDDITVVVGYNAGVFGISFGRSVFFHPFIIRFSPGMGIGVGGCRCPHGSFAYLALRGIHAGSGAGDGRAEFHFAKYAVT